MWRHACAELRRRTLPVTTSLLDGHRPDGSILLVAGGGARRVAITASTFVGAVLALADRLPRGEHALQRCEHTAAFLLSTCAAWCAGQTVGDAADAPGGRPRRADRTLSRRLRARRRRDRSRIRVRRAGIRRDRRSRAAARRRRRDWPPPELRRRPRRRDAVHLRIDARPARDDEDVGFAVPRRTTFAKHASASGRATCTLAGTVIPQHMFGLEATIMAALRTGCALDGLATALRRRPRRARASRRACRGSRRCASPRRRSISSISTARSPAMPRPPCARIIVSTMPMSRELAAQRGARLVGARRRDLRQHRVRHDRGPSSRDRRRPSRSAADLALRIDGGRCRRRVGRANSTHRSSWTTGSPGQDEARRRFTLEGRKSDMVKVAGKRTTLHGARRPPAAGRGRRRRRVLPERRAARPAVRAGRGADAHRGGACADASRERIDATFMPRPLILTDGAAARRSRQARADRAASPDRRGRHGRRAGERGRSATRGATASRASASSRPIIPSLPGHFPGNPIVPGVLLLAQVERALRRARPAGGRVHAGQVRRPGARRRNRSCSTSRSAISTRSRSR